MTRKTPARLGGPGSSVHRISKTGLNKCKLSPFTDMSPELETLDQLLGGELRLTIIQGLYPDEAAFMKGVLGLLASGDVRLFSVDDTEVPRWRWRELFGGGSVMSALDNMKLRITDQGIKRIA